ncbi:hypothetical protein [Dyella japonica]|uniref:Uncharacterized protein n=1 Tax=Dyella japonica A8 TaxID=1217721 RepID=A0A075K3J1_9GAMM|nr:hypothetical protein [Dyella japonica]AIF48791.1 hypothetical protein HY57_16840 [Dyella japonica A8]
MGHDKTRSDVSVGNVDWEDPRLTSLLSKIDGWNIDNRNHVRPQEVLIRVTCGWSASDASKPALLISEADGVMVLGTYFPLPHGEEVQVQRQNGAEVRTCRGVVVEEREGHRAEDREQHIYLNWLRIRSS